MLPPCLEYLLEKQTIVKAPPNSGARITMGPSGGTNSSTRTQLGGQTLRTGNKSGQASYSSRVQSVNLGSAPTTQIRTRHYSADTDNPQKVYKGSGGTTIRRGLQHMPRGGNMGGGSRGTRRSSIRQFNTIHDFFKRWVPQKWKNSFYNFLDS